MLFDSSVRRELAKAFGATLVVLLTIVLTTFLIRTVGQAAEGAVAVADVVLLLGYAAMGNLPLMMSLSLFVAVVLTLGRMYRDSEMAIWFASGIGLGRFVRPVLSASWPVLLAIAVLQLVVWPWGNRNSLELRNRFQQRSDLSRVTPGVFQTSADGQRVFFVERESQDGVNARQVFILQQLPKGESVVSAKAGRLETEGDDRYLVLEAGQRHDEDRNTGERTRASFDRYRVLAGERAARGAAAYPPKATGTLDLIRTPTAAHQGQLTWRVGLLLGAVNLVLLGISLASTNPRRASNWNLLFALLSFLVYYNLINLSQAWVASERVAIGPMLLGLHGGAFALAMGLLWWRDNACTMGRRARRRKAEAGASA